MNFVTPVSPSVPHDTTRLQLEVFPLHLVVFFPEYLSRKFKFSWKSHMIKRVLYIETYVHLWEYFTERLLEWEIFQANFYRKSVEKIQIFMKISWLNGYFISRPMYIYENISVNAYWNEKYFRQICTENLSRKSKFSWKSHMIKRVLYIETYVHLWEYFTERLLEWEIFQTNLYRNQSTLFMYKDILSENIAVCEIMWKNTV